MKQKNVTLTVLFSLFLCSLLFASCNDDNDMKPIELLGGLGIENHSLDIQYPGGAHSFNIVGGDGKYSASAKDESIVKVELSFNNTVLKLIPQKPGKTMVSVEDESGFSFTFETIVDYYTMAMVAIKTEAAVLGDELTADEKTEITNKALATIPIQVKGGYKFVFTDTQQTEGKLLAYPAEYGKDAVEYPFKKERNDVPKYTYIYRITTSEGEREFLYNYASTRLSINPGFLFTEDLTDKFKAEYPKVDKVYTLQTLSFRESFGEGL